MCCLVISCSCSTAGRLMARPVATSTMISSNCSTVGRLMARPVATSTIISFMHVSTTLFPDLGASCMWATKMWSLMVVESVRWSMCLSPLLSSSNFSELGRVLHNCMSPSSSPVLVLAKLSRMTVSTFIVSLLGDALPKVWSTLKFSLCPLFIVC